MIEILQASKQAGKLFVHGQERNPVLLIIPTPTTGCCHQEQKLHTHFVSLVVFWKVVSQCREEVEKDLLSGRNLHAVTFNKETEGSGEVVVCASLLLHDLGSQPILYAFFWE